MSKIESESGRPPLGAIRLVASTFRVLRGRSGWLGLLAVLAALPTMLVYPHGPEEGTLLSRIAVTVSQLWVYGLACGVVIHEMAARAPDLSRLARRAFRRMPAMVVASFLSTLLVVALLVLGFLAADRAGLFFSLILVTALVVTVGIGTAFRVSLVVAFVEGLGGLAALRRSAALTRGRRLRIFIADAILAVTHVPLITLAFSVDPDSAFHRFAHLALSSYGFAVSVTFAGVLYAELRKSEGADAREIAESL